MLLLTVLATTLIGLMIDDDEERRKGGVGILRDVVCVGLLLAWDHYQDKDDDEIRPRRKFSQPS